jgi:hypothetical protein
MTLGATYYVLGVTLLSVVFPALVVGAWSQILARHNARAPRTHAAGAPHAA